jgi:ligand-binding sensor domain-containing protein/signal transduction histidine kinase
VAPTSTLQHLNTSTLPHMRILPLVIIICLAVPGHLRAQEYSLQHYTVVNGLPQSQVNVMVEDGQGYLWIGTNGGLARFDGREFKVYTTLDGLLSNFITSLMIDSKQNLWIVHPRGITRFDGVSFYKFQPPGQTPEMRRIRKVLELGDSIVIVSGSGMLGKIYNDSVFYWSKPLQEKKMVFFAHSSFRHDIYFYLNDSSFFIAPVVGERKKISHKRQFGKVYNMFNFNRDVLIDTDSGFYSIDFKQGKFLHREFNIRGHVIAYDSLNKIIWSRNENVFYRNPLEGSDQRYDTIFHDMRVTQVLFDGEGNTWFATDGDGLYKYFMRDFERVASGKITSVMAIEKDDAGNTWIGSSSKGLWRMNKGKFKEYPIGFENKSEVFSIKESPEGTLWVASLGGLGKYNAAKDYFEWYRRENGLSSQYIIGLDFDEKGGLWCATTGGGVNYFRHNVFKSFSTEAGMVSRNASSIKYFLKYKTLYIGSELGLNTIHDNVVREIPVPDLANSSIISIQLYNDSLVMLGSTGAGIVFLDPVSKGQKQLTTRDGLLSNYIYFVTQDKDGRVWVGTAQGISRIKFNPQLEIVENINYGFENGLTGLEANQNAFYLGSEKYFGLIDGLYKFNDVTTIPLKEYKLHLTQVESFYGEFSSRDFADSTSGVFQIPYKPSFPFDKNHITFRFNRVDKRYPKSVEYKYLLENFDKKWSRPTSVGQVTYSNLPPGNYVLNVAATNMRGSWDEKPLRYAFIIQMPFYKTIPFVAGVIILVVGLIVLYSYSKVKLRIKNVLELERIRNQEQDSLRKEIARDFHDEMGNQLTRIINYISLMKMSGNGHAANYYQKVEESAKYLYTGTRDFIWSIDPGNDELSQVFIHIRDFGEKLFEEKNIQFRAFNEIKEKLKIPYGFSRELNLIIKEAMTNSFNYSEAHNVSFSLKKEPEFYEMMLEDDGIGFELDQIQHLNGITNMRSRAERMNASLHIDSVPGKGTIIRLNFLFTQTTNPWQPYQKSEF